MEREVRVTTFQMKSPPTIDATYHLHLIILIFIFISHFTIIVLFCVCRICYFQIKFLSNQVFGLADSNNLMKSRHLLIDLILI